MLTFNLGLHVSLRDIKAQNLINQLLELLNHGSGSIDSGSAQDCLLALAAFQFRTQELPLLAQRKTVAKLLSFSTRANAYSSGEDV